MDDEEERASRALVTILDSPAGAPLDPLAEPATVDALEPRERIAVEGHPPMHGRTNVRAHRGAVNAHHRIPFGGNGELAERRPQKRARRDEAARHVRSGHGERVAHQHRRPASVAAAQKEIESHAVGIRDARHAVAARSQVLLLQLPLKDDAAMSSRSRRRRQAPRRRCRTWQRGDARRSARERAERGECDEMASVS